MPRKLSNEFVINFFKERNLLPLEKYKNSVSKILILCLVCGNKWKTKYTNVQSGCGCPECGKKKSSEKQRLAYGDVKNYIYENSGDILLDKEYINSRTKLNIQCSICEKIYKITFDNFKYSGARCCFCGRNERTITRKKTIDEIREFVEKANCKLISTEYENSWTNLIFVCECGNTFSACWNSFRKDHRCMRCGRRKTLLSMRTPLEKALEIYEKLDITLLGNFVTKRLPVKVLCNKCGAIWEASLASTEGRGCPACHGTLGETTIKNFLNYFKISYIVEKKFTECRYKNVLPFDFCVYVNDYMILIEYQGLHHYEPVDFAGRGLEWATKNFEEQKIKDEIKRQYCFSKNIKLVEISYWEIDNIKEILIKELGL